MEKSKNKMCKGRDKMHCFRMAREARKNGKYFYTKCVRIIGGDGACKAKEITYMVVRPFHSRLK